MSFSTMPGYRPGHNWVASRHSDRTRFSRRLGVLEQRFDIASCNGGQSDTFVRLRLSLEVSGSAEEPRRRATRVWLSRLLLAWTQLRAKHPLLNATIEDDPGSVVPGCPARRFVYDQPTPSEAIRLAQNSFLVAPGEDLDRRMQEIQDSYILNGERVLLDEKKCLARLVFVEPKSSPGELGFFLVISHVISDGLSVFNLVKELFEIASDPNHSSPTEPNTFLDFDNFLKGGEIVEMLSLPSALHESWKTTLPANEILAALPLSTEDHLPPLPLDSIPSQPPEQPVEAPLDSHAASVVKNHASVSAARRRWIWAITRTLILARQRRFPHSLHIPRLTSEVPPTRPKTKWEFLRFDKETSSKLFRFCKLNGQSPSMLLYSMLSLATANLFATLHPSEPYHPVLVGFPFSARRFLEQSPSPSSDPSSDLAIRITFGSIHLPNLPLDLEDNDPSVVRTAVLRSAKLAKRQFAHRLAPAQVNRTVFLATADGLNIDRLLLRYKQARPPWEDPKTCINASMIGDVDRILPTTFTCDNASAKLSDLQIGTRLHLGEGNFNEGFTFDGMLQLSMGIDDQFIDPEHIATIMNGVERMGKLIAEGEALR